jgi:hypothetical protein
LVVGSETGTFPCGEAELTKIGQLIKVKLNHQSMIFI